MQNPTISQIDRPKVLVVEDEALILMNLEDMLTEAGYDDITAEDGVMAIDLLETSISAIRCVVTDIRLPGKVTGWDIAKRARELAGSMPIIYVTGDSAGEWASHGVPQSLLLGKPYAISQLTTAVAQLLTARSSQLVDLV